MGTAIRSRPSAKLASPSAIRRVPDDSSRISAAKAANRRPSVGVSAAVGALFYGLTTLF